MNKSWKKIWSREYTVQYCQAALEALGREVKDILPQKIKHAVIIPENENLTCYFYEDEDKDFIDALITTFSKDEKSFSQFVKLFHGWGVRHEDFARDVYEMDLGKLSNVEIQNIYLEYWHNLISYSSLVWAGYLLNEYWADWGENYLEVAADVKEALMSPVKKSTVFIMQEEARKVSKGEMELVDFFEKYKWMPCLDLQANPWMLEDAKEMVESVKLEKAREVLTFEEASGKAKLNNDEIGKFRMIKELAYIKDVRDDYRRKGIFFIQKLFYEIAKRMEVEYENVCELTKEEIIEFLDGKNLNLGKLKNRKNRFVMYLKGGKISFFDDKVDERIEKLGLKEKKLNLKSVKGVVGSQGKASGVVRIVRKVRDIKKVKEGDILIAVTTHPDYVVAMQKAAGIVTDEGGTLSHAAIVSRELEIPCVAGTGDATRIFKDGDEVIVDAVSGVVSIKE